ncbi:hypothetical protein B0H14DRAFT_3871549 [Mycena olivaceomarginata]|nr:hypothetical protein B0H14DRAFT_3871549 [Mycena olivaceomarginata]
MYLVLHLYLFLSFRSVNVEWIEVDGMCSSSLPRLAAPAGRALALPSPAPANAAPGTRDPIRPRALPLPPHANAHHSYSSFRPRTRTPFAVLTNAHLASFGKDDTICVAALVLLTFLYLLQFPSTHSTHAVAFPASPHRSSSAPTPTPTPTYLSTLSPPTPPGVPPMVRSVSSPPALVRTSLAPGGKPRLAASSRGKRQSPVKGLFPFSLSSSHSASTASTPCPIRVPLPPMVCVDGDAPDEDDETS